MQISCHCHKNGNQHERLMVGLGKMSKGAWLSACISTMERHFEAKSSTHLYALPHTEGGGKKVTFSFGIEWCIIQILPV